MNNNVTNINPTLNTKQDNFRSGFITLVGRPNVGKSTLLNTLVDQNVAIVSEIAQTTRHVIRGIRTTAKTQMIICDTPGLHKPQDYVGSMLNKKVKNSINEADVIIMLAPSNEYIGTNDRILIQHLKKTHQPLIIAITKIDLVSDEEVATKLQEWEKILPKAQCLPISSLNKTNIEKLIRSIETLLPDHIRYFDPDMITDQSERFFVTEIIRKQILKNTREEIPHSIAIELLELSVDEKLVRIEATIIANRPSQKAILIGAKGAKIKKMSMDARRDLELFYHKKVFINIRIKVINRWKQSPSTVKKWIS